MPKTENHSQKKITVFVTTSYTGSIDAIMSHISKPEIWKMTFDGDNRNQFECTIFRNHDEAEAAIAEHVRLATQKNAGTWFGKITSVDVPEKTVKELGKKNTVWVDSQETYPSRTQLILTLGEIKTSVLEFTSSAYIQGFINNKQKVVEALNLYISKKKPKSEKEKIASKVLKEVVNYYPLKRLYAIVTPVTPSSRPSSSHARDLYDALMPLITEDGQINDMMSSEKDNNYYKNNNNNNISVATTSTTQTPKAAPIKSKANSSNKKADDAGDYNQKNDYELNAEGDYQISGDIPTGNADEPSSSQDGNKNSNDFALMPTSPDENIGTYSPASSPKPPVKFNYDNDGYHPLPDVNPPIGTQVNFYKLDFKSNTININGEVGDMMPSREEIFGTR